MPAAARLNSDKYKGGGREARTAQLSTTMEPQEDDRCHLPPLTLETEEDEDEERKSECTR
ncbi:hypothetical protein EYF80_035483 [Liparis tanakae]|uniref:Uncharacterized protein n=1 Tax=Liparis tanakae TaxID=230148 RepID=A0A4Z2GNF6_9TELE|nr:hypothetical protein EYF80_035483 [Liparis tanakae]